MATATEIMTEAPSTPKISAIRSNTGTIKEEQIGRLRPTSKDTPVSEMKKRFEEDGYLFVKNLIPRADVLKVRRAYFEHYEPTGILQPGTSPEDGIFNSSQDPNHHAGIGAGTLPPEDLQVQTMIDSHAIPDYLHFLEHPALRQCVRDLMGWKKDILLRRTMIRHSVPGGVSTGIHYDKIFLRDGDSFFLTAWVPIGKAPTPTPQQKANLTPYRRHPPSRRRPHLPLLLRPSRPAHRILLHRPRLSPPPHGAH